MALKVRNWDKFQHYKDRCPPWIKLHRGLLEDFRFYSLSTHAKAVLPLLWLLASEEDGSLPDLVDVAWRLREDEVVMGELLEELCGSGFLQNGDAPAIQRENWPSRHVSEKLRAEVLARDGGKCRLCGTTEALEIDHVHPVSKGGESKIDNLQVLCRSCNRRKRTRPAEQVATQSAAAVEPRDREEAEAEAEPEGKTEQNGTDERRSESQDAPSPMPELSLYGARIVEDWHRLRGSDFPQPSNRDFLQLSDWHAAGIPPAIVERGLMDCIETMKRRKDKPQGKPLAYYNSAVRQAHSQWRKAIA